LNRAANKKWRATVNGRPVCVSVAPFVTAARTLLAEGQPADTPIEMWRSDAAQWALRGQLGAVAATVLDGEKASPRAKNVPPVNVPCSG
jgi:hypothetical protein